MTSSGAAVKFSLLPQHLLRFPPASEPQTLPVPPDHSSFAHPFAIPPHIYNTLLDVRIPLTIAAVYAVTAVYLNKVNADRRRKNGGKPKPWAISQTYAFFVFVLAHNIFLAAYSLWTCAGLIYAVTTSWPGWNGPYGLAGAVDAFCKINGPRGLGDATTYNESGGAWGVTNKLIHLGADGLTPDSTDVGRIWNEGLAFYGWLFYVSKFYEVVDTLIIIAQGKKSSFLQTYHHAGAMMCMWAGIRYMAPPIWMFVMVNSGIHGLMYAYYSASTLSIKVPKIVKQTITTLQIVQFVVGASFAFSHLLVAYSIPTLVPYTYSFADLTSSVASDISSAAAVATASASADIGSWLKKLAFRAAGQEGLAENVLNSQGETFGIDAAHAAQDLKERTETRYREEFHFIHCTDTSGQVFAILINCLYLAPLTALFVRFFYKSYIARLERRRSSSSKPHLIKEATRDALKGTNRESAEESVVDKSNVKTNGAAKNVSGDDDAEKLDHDGGEKADRGASSEKKHGDAAEADAKADEATDSANQEQQRSNTEDTTQAEADKEQQEAADQATGDPNLDESQDDAGKGSQKEHDDTEPSKTTKEGPKIGEKDSGKSKDPLRSPEKTDAEIEKDLADATGSDLTKTEEAKTIDPKVESEDPTAPVNLPEA